MNEQLPSVTVVIAARPGQPDLQAVAGSRRLDYPAEKLEIIVARGKQPSVQRNTALRAARNEWIYFLDDDSVPWPGNLRRALPLLSRPEVKMVGGPNLCPPDAPTLEQVFALVLSAWLAFGPSRARYAPVGVVRATSEKELILCNLMARRDTLLELGGFNEALYPNEENALMDDIQKRGGKLMYDPDFLVYRRPRSSLKSFARMLMTYGRGRAEQFRLNPTLGSALNFVPPAFLVYLLYLAIVPFLSAFTRLRGVSLIPLGFYGLAVLGQTVALAVGRTRRENGISNFKFQISNFDNPSNTSTDAGTNKSLNTERASAAERVSDTEKAPNAKSAPNADDVSNANRNSPKAEGGTTRLLRSLGALPLIVLTHVLYGFGFWRGLFTPLAPAEKRVPVEVTLEHMSLK